MMGNNVGLSLLITGALKNMDGLKYESNYKCIDSSFMIKSHLGGLGRYDVPCLVIRQSSWKYMRTKYSQNILDTTGRKDFQLLLSQKNIKKNS